jgi:hypothetical protein
MRLRLKLHSNYLNYLKPLPVKDVAITLAERVITVEGVVATSVVDAEDMAEGSAITTTAAIDAAVRILQIVNLCQLGDKIYWLNF